jgi:hypothetical protein
MIQPSLDSLTFSIDLTVRLTGLSVMRRSSPDARLSSLGVSRSRTCS